MKSYILEIINMFAVGIYGREPMKIGFRTALIERIITLLQTTARRSRINGPSRLSKSAIRNTRDVRRRNFVARRDTTRVGSEPGRRESGRSRLQTGEKSNDKSRTRGCGYALGSKRLNKCSNFKITR